MNISDLVKESTTSTSTSTISLGGAANGGFQSFIGSGLAIGTTDIPVKIGPDSAGGWLLGLFALSGPSTLTRTQILKSSTGGDVVLAAGTKDVICAVPSAMLIAGLLNPDDAGFDIVLCAGQSNMEGNPTSDPLIDISDPRVFQWSTPLGDATRHQILNSTEPLYMVTGPRTGKIGPATWFAKAYLSTVPQNRKVLLIPMAAGSTGMVGTGAYWLPGSPGGGGYETAISESNLAITAALALYPNSRFVGILWAQGEADALNNIPQWQYALNLKALIAGFRSRISGAANSWFVISSMTPEGMSAEAREVPIDAAHKQVVAEVDRCAFVSPVTGMAAGVHYTAPGIRIIGTRMGLATLSAKKSIGKDTTAPTIVAAAVANATPSTVSLTFSEVLDASSTPTAAAVASCVAGHTISSVAISGNTATLGLTAPFVNGETRNFVYAKPGAGPIKDLAGNALADGATIAITNNVAAATDTTAPTVSGTPTISNGSPTVIAITFSEALAAGTPPTGAYTVTGTQTAISSVAISGSTLSITMASAYVAGNNASVSYAPTGTGDLQDAVGNKVVAFGPLAVTNNAGAAVTAPDAPTIGTAVAGDGYVDVAFTAPASNGGSIILDYTATLSTGESATGTTSPLRVTAANGSARTATVKARNAVGLSAASAASNSVTPQAAGGGTTTYATMSATDKDASITLTNGNLTATGTVAGFRSARANTGKSAGKWYWEGKVTGAGGVMVGFGTSAAALNNFAGSNDVSIGYYTTGTRYRGNGTDGTQASYTTNDVIGVAIDIDAKTATFYKNGVSQGQFSLVTNLATAGLVIFPMVTTNANGAALLMNFGAAAFAYTPPAGYSALTA
jgi:hypothetical protein